MRAQAAQAVSQPSGGSTSAETVGSLLRQLHTVFANCGVPLGNSKASRFARQYDYRVRVNGWDFFDFITNKLALTVEQQERLAREWHRVICYADPTGELAVENVIATNPTQR